MNSFLMWIAGLAAAVLAALFAVPYFIDWNGYRGVFEEEASRILGREVRVGGKVNVRLLPTPYLRFEKLRIADTLPGTGEPLFRAENFTLWLSVPPLLQGNLEARHVALEAPVLSLAVDETGTGNWTTIGVRPGALPFVPHNVALQAVEITNGTLLLRHPKAGEVARVEGIAGEVSAEALDGPVKFAGEIAIGGIKRDVRFATAKVDGDGTLRFKATARPVTGAAAVYQLEGSVSGLSAKTRLEGQLSATVPLPELPAAAALPAAGAVQPGQKAPTSVFADVKGRLIANADRLEITDLVASIENVGQPQLVTGRVEMAWGDTRRLDFEVSSRWLDLDRLAGATGRAAPVETVATLIRGLTSGLPDEGATRGVVSVEQLTLGGAAVAQIDLAVSRATKGRFRIERLFASLPAGARLGLDGIVAASSAVPGFDGRVTLAGPSLDRLTSWAFADHEFFRSWPAGSFAFDGRITASDGGFAVDGARLRLADQSLTGDARLAPDGRLQVSVDAETIESAWLWSGRLSRNEVMSWIDGIANRLPRTGPASGGGSPTIATKPAGETSAPPADASNRPSFHLKLTTRVLRGHDLALRDVALDIAAAHDSLDVKRLAFRTGNGVAVDVAGSLADRRGARNGRFTGTLAAADAKAMTTLLELLDLSIDGRTGQLPALAPLRVAGEMVLGGRTPTSVTLSADGAMMAGRVTVAVRLDGGPSGRWRQAPAELTLSAEHVSARRLLAALFARDAAPAAGDEAARSTDWIALKAVGVPAEGLVADVALTRDGLSVAYSGRATLDEQAVPALAGSLEIAAERFGDVTALAGIGPLGEAAAAPVNGSVGLGFRDGGRVVFEPSNLTVAGARVDGRIEVARAASGKLGIDGDLSIDQATIPALLAGLVGGPPKPAPVTASELAFEQPSGLWTDQPFAPEMFERFEGSVRSNVGRLNLSPGLSLAGARLGLTFAAGEVIGEIKSDAVLDGRLDARIKLSRAAAGAHGEGRIAVENAELGSLARALSSAMPASGRVAATLDFDGQGLTPRSVISALKGNGTIKLSEAAIDGLTPDAVRATIVAGFDKKIEFDAASLEKEIRSRLGQGRLTLGTREIPVEVAAGALRVARFTTSAAAGNVETLATVDLATLQSETEWRLAVGPDAPSKPAWPAISVYYTGSLGGLAGVEPRIALGTFERELMVRRMEHEVDQLERLRKLDEERVRLERERQNALAEQARRERLRAAEEAEALRRRAPGLQAPGAADGTAVPATPSGPGAVGPQLAPNSPAAAAVPSQPAPSPQGAAAASGGESEASQQSPRERRRVSPHKEPSAADATWKSLNPSAY